MDFSVGESRLFSGRKVCPSLEARMESDWRGSPGMADFWVAGDVVS